MSFSYDDVTSRYFDQAQIARLKEVRVGIAGAGGLGSNCAHILVRSGIHRFVVADFDTVEPSNLNRQFYFPDQVGRPKVDCLKENLSRINPGTSIAAHTLKLDEDSMLEMFETCQIIVEAFDGAETKAKLVSLFAPSDKLVVSGSGMVGIGQSDTIITRKLRDNVFIVGDSVSDCRTQNPYAPRVTVAAAKMADIVLSWVLST